MSGKSRHPKENNVKVKKSHIDGLGVFAQVEFDMGDKIGFFCGDEKGQHTQHSLTLKGKIIEPKGALKRLNHSCDPNSFFDQEYADGRVLFASRKIAIGEEITIDYFATEILPLTNPFICKCPAENPDTRVQQHSFS